MRVDRPFHGRVGLAQPVGDRRQLIVVEALVDLGDLGAQRGEALRERTLCLERADHAVVGEVDDHLAPVVRVGATFDEAERRRAGRSRR